MSIPVSIGDCHLLVKGLCKLTSLLRGEAVEEFKQYKTIYHQLTGLSGYLGAFLESDEAAQDIFAKDVKRIRRLLKRFYSKIKHLKPHLDNGRPRKSFFGAIAKIKWPRYSQKLQKLHNNLKEQISIIAFKKQFYPSRENHPPADGFTLINPRGERGHVDFVSVSSWACLHELLLRVFPENDPGNEAIVHQRYLIHKTDSDIDILPSRPAKSFRDTVNKDDRIEISIIFPYEDRYETHCPRCDQERRAEFTGMALTCPNCDLLLFFKDSHDNAPDPLTEAVLQDIQSSGRRAFVERFIAQTTHQDGCSCSRRRGASITQQELQCRIISHVGGLIARGPIPLERQKSQIRDFSRVTLCRVQWPDLSRHNVHRKASKQLRRSISGIRRHVEWLETEDFPIEMASVFLNSRISDGRITRGKLQFFKPLLQAFQSQAPHFHYSTETARILCSYLHCIDNEMAQFQAPNLEFRCLLWICWYVLSTEADIRRGHSALLNRWWVPEGRRRDVTPLILKLVFLPHAVIFPTLCRFTLDLVLDLKEQFDDVKPLHIPVGIHQMVQRSSTISTQFYLDGHLNNYFSAPGVKWRACQDWVEAIMRSKGLKLESVDVYNDLERIMADG